MARFSLILPTLALLCAARADAPKAAVKTLPVTTFDGQTLDLMTKPGWKVVYFWSVSCPCVRDCETLSFVPLAEKYRGRVTFYAVDSNAPDLSSDVKILAQNASFHRLPFPVVLDKKAKIADVLGARCTPQTFLIDPSGTVVFNGPPDDSWTVKSQTGKPGVTKSYLADALSEALSGQKIKQPTVKAMGCGIAR